MDSRNVLYLIVIKFTLSTQKCLKYSTSLCIFFFLRSTIKGCCFTINYLKRTEKKSMKMFPLTTRMKILVDFNLLSFVCFGLNQNDMEVSVKKLYIDKTAELR